MKGLVLAGGAGTRLRPLTHTGAKQLVPVANRPILFYVIDNLVGAGITDIGIVISPETGREIQTALGDGGRFAARFTFILQSHPGGLAHAVVAARDFLGVSDFAMYLGDNLIGTGIADAVSAFRTRPQLVAHVMLKDVQDPSAFGVAELDDSGRIARFVEKPKAPRSRLALVGIYLFRSPIHDAIDQIRPSMRGELEITDALSRLIERGCPVDFTRVSSWWLDTGKKDDLLLANATILDDRLEPGIFGTVDADSKLSGRVRIGAGSTVVRSTIRGPVIVGEGVTITDARIEPFSAIGDGAIICRSTIAHSVLMDRGQVSDIGRLEDSLIGKRVVVRPGPGRHGALALMVGDDSVVELSADRPRGGDP